MPLPAVIVYDDGLAEIEKSGAGVVTLTLSIVAVFKTVLSCEHASTPVVTALAIETVTVSA